MSYYINMNIRYDNYNFKLAKIDGHILRMLSEYLGRISMVIEGEAILTDNMVGDSNDLIEMLKDENEYEEYEFDEEIQEIISWLEKTN